MWTLSESLKKRLLNRVVTVRSIIDGPHGTIPKNLEKITQQLKIRERIETVQTTEIDKKVTEYRRANATCSHCDWMKPIKDNNIINNNNYNIKKKIPWLFPRKILWAILKVDQRRTSTNGSENKKVLDYGLGLTSQRWRWQTIFVKKRRRKGTGQHSR